MKQALFCIFIFFSFQTFAQDMPVDSVTGKIIYTEVVAVSGVAKEELYSRARDWFTRTYKSPEDVLQIQDKEVGKLTGKCVVVINSGTATFSSYHLVTIMTKNGRYKYEISDFIYKHNTNGTTYSYDTWKGYGKKTVLMQTDAQIREVIKSLKSSMSSPIVAKDDW